MCAYIGSKATINTNYNLEDIDILNLPSGKIVAQIINRIKYLCQKDILYLYYKDLSILLDKSDRYIAHLFNENYWYDPSLEVIIKFAQISHIPLEVLFYSEKVRFVEFFKDDKKRKEFCDIITSEIEMLINNVKITIIENRSEIPKLNKRLQKLQALLRRRKIKLLHCKIESEMVWKFQRRELIDKFIK